MAADVTSTLASWSTTESGNQPEATDAISIHLDDNLRMIQAVVRQLAASDSVASAAISDGTNGVPGKTSAFLTVTGTTTITALGTLAAGMYKWLVFDGALTLTHNGTSLILPTGANITTAAGDTAFMLSLGSGNWRCLSYNRINGAPLTATSAFADGSVTTPAINFTADTNTGIYRIGTDNLGVATAGIKRLDIAEAIGIIGDTTVTGTLAATSTFQSTTLKATSDGTASSPAIVVSDADTGFHYSGGPLKYFTTTVEGVDVLKIYSNLGIIDAQYGKSDKSSTHAFYTNITSSAWVFRVITGSNVLFSVTGEGDAFCDGSFTGGGADYAEYFDFTGNRPEVGDSVTLDGDRVRIAVEGDDVIGVVSEKPAVVGDFKGTSDDRVAIGLVGKLRVKNSAPRDPRWRFLRVHGPDEAIWLVR